MSLMIILFLGIPLDEKIDEVEGTLQYYCPPSCTLQQSLSSASSMYNVSQSRLACLVRRESTNNPNAQNGQYMGYTQFNWQAWGQTPYANYSPYNGWANIHAAAYVISIGQSSRFEAWRYC